MDKAYSPQNVEGKIYEFWEKGGYFTPQIDLKKKPFTILLPLPNANDPMHMGHAMFAVQDILVRYHRMMGDPTLWLPGGDHAGIETQYVFEKKLAKEGKSRFDFDRKTLYHMISDYVEQNKDVNRNQLKRLGFSLDWTRYHYSLEPNILQTVFDTFYKLYKDGLVYRDNRLVNYCTKCGTSYSELEIKHIEQIDPLYYMKYGPFVLATVRPETKFGDTAVAVNPKDTRYKQWIGKKISVQGLLGSFTVTVVGDDVIDPTFGTGVAKVTPAHDFTDFEIAKRHNLPSKQIIGFDGKLTGITGPYAGLKVKAAREKVVADLSSRGLMDHIDPSYTHSVATCYKCGTVIEPLPLPQWYVKTKPLATPAIDAVKKHKTKIFPLKRFEKMYFDWMNNILDWNISRQIVWGPRFPVWYNVDENPNLEVVFLDKNGVRKAGNLRDILNTNGGRDYTLEQVEKGLQQLIAHEPSKYIVGHTKPGERYLQDTDTFDTWFLSSQWPLTTLGYPHSKDFTYFYPTSTLDTMWDILFFWVARMMMMGLYRTGKVPFEVVHLHSRVVDAKGQKMSKSKGNVMNPIDMADKYGADALRFTLIFGAAPGGDIAVSEGKIRGMRNFTNKLWNIGRFVTSTETRNETDSPLDKELKNKTASIVKTTTKRLQAYQFGQAAEELYEFIWHEFADVYVEAYKQNTISYAALSESFTTLLKLLHPFMPFVTEELYQKMPGWDGTPLIISSWPR